MNWRAISHISDVVTIHHCLCRTPSLDEKAVAELEQFAKRRFIQIYGVM
jgi:hypothetical protein